MAQERPSEKDEETELGGLRLRKSGLLLGD
jgi:hypothetical protein